MWVKSNVTEVKWRVSFPKDYDSSLVALSIMRAHKIDKELIQLTQGTTW